MFVGFVTIRTSCRLPSRRLRKWPVAQTVYECACRHLLPIAIEDADVVVPISDDIVGFFDGMSELVSRNSA